MLFIDFLKCIYIFELSNKTNEASELHLNNKLKPHYEKFIT